MEKGQLSIHAENFLPIIKKWLYSDKDIFLRELISNGCDAIAKRKTLGKMGEEEPVIVVDVNKQDKTLSFTDNGIGMTGEEVRKYINQVAFSGASDFLEKYKDTHEQLIGHFGLGFYSAFMVSAKVRIETKSCIEGESAVAWESDGGMEYQMEEITRDAIGTTVILYLNDDALEFAEEATVRTTIEKYCSFMPVPIRLSIAGELQMQTVPCEHHHEDGEECTCEHHHEDGEECTCEHEHEEGEAHEEKKEPVVLNDIHPLYAKTPREVTAEEYKTFYRKTFHIYEEPLFWIHLNVDYPFNLKGILYFPRIKNEFGANDGQVKLYAGQVFVADNIKEVIPEFLLLLKGVIDCPDLPLNVSRSFLQNDGYVRKLSDYITRKVADKLNELFKNERETYDQYWDDIHPFIKYGCLRDDKFYDRVKDSLIYKTAKGESFTLPELTERAKEQGHENKLYYTPDEKRQAATVKLYDGMDVLVLGAAIDNPYLQHIEGKTPGLSFARVDAEVADALKGGENTLPKEDEDKLLALFKWALDNDSLKVQAQALKDEALPAMVLRDENMRRYMEAMRMWSGKDMPELPLDATYVLNAANPLIRRLAAAEQNDESKALCLEIRDLAELAIEPLTPEKMNDFLMRTIALVNKLA